MSEPKKRGRPKSGKPQKADRHKERRAVTFTVEMYAALGELAKRGNRPVTWEVRTIVQQALEAAGLWPPKPGD